jgi:hypothetical protein
MIIQRKEKVMSETMVARARLEMGMRFEASAGSGHRVTLDASMPDGGQDTGFRPMELLLVGLGVRGQRKRSPLTQILRAHYPMSLEMIRML